MPIDGFDAHVNNLLGSAALLHVDGLGRRVGNAWIWREIDIELAAGEQLAVVGATGSGKSLLLRCLASLDTADEGALAFDGRRYDDWEMPELRSRVVYLHQRPALWEGTVEDNLAAAFRWATHREQQYDRSRAVQWLARLDRNESFLCKSTTDLSGGEQQITALVRALCIDPSLLLLDEASASMDTAATGQAESLIARWIAEGPARAAVWASHDADQVLRVAARTLFLPGAAP